MKKLLTLLLALIMVFSMVACGAKEEAKEPVKEAAPAEKEEVKEEAPAEEATEEAPAEDIGWPESTINVIVGANPGGGTDNMARATNKFMTEALGVNMVVTNVGGASGSIGSAQVKDADPDGYTCLFVNDDFTNAQLNGYADYGIESFKTAGICVMCYNIVFVTSTDWATFDEFVEYCKANPGAVTMGVTMGTFMEQFAHVMEQSLGIDINIVDCGASGDVVASLIGGHVDCAATPIGFWKDYIAQGDVVAHGLLAQTPDPLYAEYPIMKDLGVDFFVPKFFTYLFPADTDDAIIEKFTATLEEVCQNQEYIDLVTGMDFTVEYKTPEEAVEFINYAYEVIQGYQEVMNSAG